MADHVVRSATVTTLGTHAVPARGGRPNPTKMTKRKRTTKRRPDHLADGSECQFGKGRTHKTFVTEADGTKYIDTTLIQRCTCGAQKITRISREPLEVTP